MKKILITGFSGFVSKHFLEYIDTLEEKIVVEGIDINEPTFNLYGFKNITCRFTQLDLLNKNEIDNLIFQFQPEYILHLASFSSVAFSWKNPVASFTNNTNIFLNLLEQIKNLNLKCRILSVGSSEEYGKVSKDAIPLNETEILNPISPYAVARVSQELLSKVYVSGYHLDIVLTRSFNHIGPGQKDLFVVPSFVKRILEIKKYNLTSVLKTGDLSIIRDFTDVRDVVRAYHLILTKGVSGEIYNVCSGNGISLEEIIKKISSNVDIDITTERDESLIRPNDNEIIIGNNSKLKKLGWAPLFNLDESICDIIKYWKDKI
ncbi:GDP-mannose 4,6-dehydratase [Chryseobacterium sp. C-71]|uniref:GDP-mannose 4,6-dehydratase n=1 Tax=Chryseobacterium sp. C-71 TaxID=2893882 RepID=UPI001E58D14D|nr:GDP-mannose 4,6-dehydratase [Chryseobacterium sp. C-71]UFH33331.1 GDP-mannose 4,6-dehydratase [Chryseobacterium sp. C-71]